MIIRIIMNNPRRRRRGAGGVGEAAAAEAAGRGEEKGVVSDIYLAGEERAGWSSSLSESPRVQRRRQRGLDYEYDFIDDSHPLLFLNSGSAPSPTLAASLGAGRRAAVGPARRSSLPAPARVGGERLSLHPAQRLRELGGRGGGGVQECGRRQLYCVRGSVCVCGAPLSAGWVPGAEEQRRTQEAPSLGGAGRPLALPLRAVPFPGRCRAPRGAGGAADGCRSNSV